MPELWEGTPEETFTIWEAEDGRCEACGRPMDRGIAQVVLRNGAGPDTSPVALVCPLCMRGLASPFETARVDKSTAEALAMILEKDKAAAAQWVRTNLQAYGVLFTASRDRLDVWLPGVGTFKITRRPDKLPIMTILKQHVITPGIITIKAQSRTRGGARLSITYENAWGAITENGDASPFWQIPKHLRIKHDTRSQSEQDHQGGTIMAKIAIRSAKMSIVVPQDQWPEDLPGVATAEFVALHVSTPEGLQLTATVKAKSFRKASKAIKTIEKDDGSAAIIVQGRLMPGLELVDAGIVVQRKTAPGGR